MHTPKWSYKREIRCLNSLVIEAWLWSRSGCQPLNRIWPVPRRVSVLAEGDSVWVGGTKFILGWEKLILPLHSCRNHVKQDDRGTHRLPEDVLSSAGETAETQRAEGQKNMRRQTYTYMYNWRVIRKALVCCSVLFSSVDWKWIRAVATIMDHLNACVILWMSHSAITAEIMNHAPRTHLQTYKHQVRN